MTSLGCITLRGLVISTVFKCILVFLFSFPRRCGTGHAVRRWSILQRHTPLYLLSSNMEQCLAVTSAVTALPAVSLPTDDAGHGRSGLATNPIRTGELRHTKTETTSQKLSDGVGGGGIGTAPFTSGPRRDAPRRRRFGGFLRSPELLTARFSPDQGDITHRPVSDTTVWVRGPGLKEDL